MHTTIIGGGLLLSNDKNKQIDCDEDETKYGETIPTMFSWMSLSEQKKKLKSLVI